MTEHASHLAGLWIGAAISNTSHSKPVLPLSNEHGSQVKGHGRWQCCHNKHKNVPVGLHVMYLYFPDTPRTSAALTSSNRAALLRKLLYISDRAIFERADAGFFLIMHVQNLIPPHIDAAVLLLLTCRLGDNTQFYRRTLQSDKQLVKDRPHYS